MCSRYEFLVDLTQQIISAVWQWKSSTLGKTQFYKNFKLGPFLSQLAVSRIARCSHVKRAWYFVSNQLGGNVTETHANHNENQHTHKRKRTFENSIFKVIFLPIIKRLICELPWQQLRNTTLISYKVVVNALTLSSVHRRQFFTPRLRAVLFPKGHVVSIEH